MRVTYSRRLMDHFRREAKHAYPREAFAVLIGRVVGDGVQVTQLYIPDGQREHATPLQITVADAWLREAKRLADASGEIVLGDIHSHVIRCPLSHWREDDAPSAGDWEVASNYIHAICYVRKYPSGRLISRITVWPSDLNLKVLITP